MRVHKGDTIIELVLAFAIFALAAVATMSILNKGVSTTQRSLETTLVREQIDAQAEIIRFLHDSANPTWATIIAPSNLVANPLPLNASCQSTTSINNGFYIRPVMNVNPSLTTFNRTPINTATYTSPSTYAKIDYNGGAAQAQGIWIQVTRSQVRAGLSVMAYDFYIHSCWDSVGINVPMTLGTIVRVYE